jgi:ubiquinone/menaquinone biosynthesis C-methylase UbiE
MIDTTARTNDLLYLHEDRYETPKEYFKFIDTFFACQAHTESVLDVGCATGEFLYFLRKKYASLRCHGIDIVPELLAKAKS